jgi:hypothetical protein
VDHSSKQQFIYSQLIFHCWAVFPCFDQPDLKAIFKLNVITNQNWVACSNAPEKRIVYMKNSEYVDSSVEGSVQS